MLIVFRLKRQLKNPKNGQNGFLGVFFCKFSLKTDHKTDYTPYPHTRILTSLIVPLTQTCWLLGVQVSHAIPPPNGATAREAWAHRLAAQRAGGQRWDGGLRRHCRAVARRGAAGGGSGHAGVGGAGRALPVAPAQRDPPRGAGAGRAGRDCRRPNACGDRCWG